MLRYVIIIKWSQYNGALHLVITLFHCHECITTISGHPPDNTKQGARARLIADFGY